MYCCRRGVTCACLCFGRRYKIDWKDWVAQCLPRCVSKKTHLPFTFRVVVGKIRLDGRLGLHYLVLNIWLRILDLLCGYLGAENTSKLYFRMLHLAAEWKWTKKRTRDQRELLLHLPQSKVWSPGLGWCRRVVRQGHRAAMAWRKTSVLA